VQHDDVCVKKYDDGQVNPYSYVKFFIIVSAQGSAIRSINGDSSMIAIKIQQKKQVWQGNKEKITNYQFPHFHFFV
jgi:uncharacterized ubiquitin-like protein YukD